MADVMQTMREQNVAEDIPMLDILRNDAKQRGVDFNNLHAMLKSDIKRGKTRIMRSGNTLLIYDIVQPSVAELHISTMDSPEKLVVAVKDLFEAMKKSGYKKGVSVTDNSQIARVLNAAGIPVAVQQLPGKDGKAEYQLTIQVQ
jgi:predicted rRNA methylase YqxC with S4 and FtsJ domains